MEWILAVVFGVVLAALDESLPALMTGALLGWLLGRVLDLDARLRTLEKARQKARTETVPGPAPSPMPAVTPTVPSRITSRPAVAREVPAASVPARATPARPRPSPAFDWRQNAILRWLLSGNVPVKVGVLVSFFGVAFLLKYAVDQGVLSLPAELRLFVVATFGGGLLWLGWRLRNSHRVYGLSIQGGGIGVLYLTTYSALRLYQVLPATMTFILLVAIAAGAGWLAVRQNARALAVLGAVGGFLAPLLASTGSGSHVALFAYYLVLNAGIAGVAWFRHWRMLNLLGFVFTFGARSRTGADLRCSRLRGAPTFSDWMALTKVPRC